ncbi:MAG TPA: hypothetical protein VI564_08295 [Candidatus Nanoarchaeia archaeon]|nr:hypothetical protein [Candidatus Nanoarchaeia archaeon]
MTFTLDQEVVVKKLVASEFSYKNLATAKERANEYAKRGGFVYSLSQLIDSRMKAPFDDEIWSTKEIACNTEEVIGKTPRKKKVLIEVQGQAILTPDRIREGYRKGLSDGLGIKITSDDVNSLLEGKLDGKHTIPIYSWWDLLRLEGKLPQVYGVVIDFKYAERSKSGYVEIDQLRKDRLFAVRAGGPEKANAYLDRALEYKKAKHWGENKHSHMNNYDKVKCDGPQARLIFLSNLDFNGIRTMKENAEFTRFLAASRKDLKTYENSLK